MKISYLITCHNEGSILEQLLGTLESFTPDDDDVVVLDDFSDDAKTKEVLEFYRNPIESKKFTIIDHSLDNNYGEHKNYGNTLCKGEWIFQIDGDEWPSTDLIVNLREIINANVGIELIFVPRINDFRGVTEEHAARWGWKLSPCPVCENRPIVNWPDYQGRIYKNESSRIRWDRRLHEKIEGHVKYATLPADYNLALYHNKTIEKQIETNLKYNKAFSQEENRGHNVFGSKGK